MELDPVCEYDAWDGDEYALCPRPAVATVHNTDEFVHAAARACKEHADVAHDKHLVVFDGPPLANVPRATKEEMEANLEHIDNKKKTWLELFKQMTGRS